MAAVENSSGSTIQLTVIDADWYSANVIRLNSIIFVPGAANDVLVLKDGAVDTKPVFCKMTSINADERIWYGHGTSKQVYLDYSACTLSANHSVIINLWPARR